MALSEQGVSPDFIALEFYLQSEGKLDAFGDTSDLRLIAQVAEFSLGNALHYAKHLLDLSGRRAVIKFALDLIAQTNDPQKELGLITSQANSDIRAAADRAGAAAWAMGSDLLFGAANGEADGLAIHFDMPGLDFLLTGHKLLSGNLALLAGPLKAGKSTYALNMIKALLDAGHHVGLVTLEMTPLQYIVKLAGLILGREMRVGVLSEQDKVDLAHLAATDERFSRLHIRKATGRKRGDIETAIRKLHSDLKTLGVFLSALFVDHLHIMQSDDPRQDTLEAQKQAAEGLKEIALDLSLLVIALAQMNKQGVRSDSPEVVDIKGAIDIGAICDVALGIHQPKDWEENGYPQFNVAVLAHRDGPAGLVAKYDRDNAGLFIHVSNDF